MERKGQGYLEVVLAIPFFFLPWSFFFTISKAATVLSGEYMCIHGSVVPKEGTPRGGRSGGRGDVKREKKVRKKRKPSFILNM